MSRFLAPARGKLVPYTPGEQPRDMQYVKLNTNESPFPPPPEVAEAAKRAAGEGNLYPDPVCRDLRETIAGALGVTAEEVTLRGLDGELTVCLDGECFTTREVTFRLADKKLNFFGPHGCDCNRSAR